MTNISHIIIFASTIFKLEMEAVVSNPYLRFLANNVTFSILDKFFIEKINSNMKTDALFYTFYKKSS